MEKKYNVTLNDSSAFVVKKEDGDKTEKVINDAKIEYKRYDDIRDLAYDEISQSMLKYAEQSNDFILEHYGEFRDEMIKPYMERENGQYAKTVNSRARKYVEYVAAKVRIEDEDK